MTTRRGFFKAAFRSVVVAAALVYAPGTLARPRVRSGWVSMRVFLKDYHRAVAQFRCFMDTDGHVLLETEGQRQWWRDRLRSEGST